MRTFPPPRCTRCSRRHVLTDGMKLVLDLQRSRGSRLVDARNGTRYLDMYTFFASAPLGLNPPGIVDDPTFMAELAEIAANKPANPDMYTTAYAEFVETFVRVLGDPALPHLFFVEGGALAVENALKVAFDWKSRQNEAAGRDPELGTKIMHLTRAFHGRSGYTLSLTNTEPNKTDRFPKFDWPRIDVPAITFPLDDHLDEVVAAEERALDQARARVRRAPARHRRLHRRADPGRGRRQPHPAASSSRRCSELVHDHDALFIFDEVQTGVGTTGTAWAYQQLGVQPDIVAFAKKAQVGGIMAGGRVDEVPDNVFARLRPDQLHLGRRAGRHGPVPADPGDHRGRRPDRGGRPQGRAASSAGLRAVSPPSPARSATSAAAACSWPATCPTRSRPGRGGRGPARRRARHRAALRRAVDPVPAGAVGERG